jgi:hypothetical protein
MFNILLAADNIWNVDLWYALPAIIAVSLVYCATRHERMIPILKHSCRVCFLISGFMLIVFAVMEFLPRLFS